jgi:hypothetical protein
MISKKQNQHIVKSPVIFHITNSHATPDFSETRAILTSASRDTASQTNDQK